MVEKNKRGENVLFKKFKDIHTVPGNLWITANGKGNSGLCRSNA